MDFHIINLYLNAINAIANNIDVQNNKLEAITEKLKQCL